MSQSISSNHLQLRRPETHEINFDLSGMKTSSVSDASLSTGATLFFFPDGAAAACDVRGGSVASSEMNLLDEGSYSNYIDGICFAGGSTMGLEAAHGVRRRIFESRTREKVDFNSIPSIPSAVVYDYSSRKELMQNKIVFPDIAMGEHCYDSLTENKFLLGRAGAGTSTTINKSSSVIWGGQGAHFSTLEFEGQQIKIFAAVILNACGNLLQGPFAATKKNTTDPIPGQNTTLSIVVTDLFLNRSQLKRLAVTVHTSMARAIFPFHSYTDGDCLFAVSLNKIRLAKENEIKLENKLQLAASNTMLEAILKSAEISNTIGN